MRPIVDEWVIVDTGSTDGTQAIISEYGPVTELPFEDFVTTKNKALALATGEYILFMDADERLLSRRGNAAGRGGSRRVWMRLAGRIIDGPAPDQVVTQYDRLRLWRNDGQLAVSRGRGCMRSSAGRPARGCCVIPASSCGTITATATARASSSGASGTSRLLQAALQRDPGDTRAMFYLARTFKDLGRWFEAIEAYERYLAAGGWHDERWQACYDLALVLA